MSELVKQCPQCNVELTYQSKVALTSSIKKNSVCRKCASKNSGFIEKFATKGKSVGKDNPFYGKKHSKESLEKLTKSHQSRDKSVYRTSEFRKKQSENNSGTKNSMYGRTVYDVWIQKYGKEEADKKLLLTKQKHSKNNSGKGNPMYGKPCPGGSGYGWKGWYKEIYFRSLRELSYMISLDEQNIEWKSAENIRIDYFLEGRERTYRPDFLVNNKYLVEIKPERLKKTILIQLKTEAAKKYCKQNNLEYQLIDVPIISVEKIKELVGNKIVKFTDRYAKKFTEKYCNNS